MRKTKQASPASDRSGKGKAQPLKARSLSELRDLQRQAGAEPTPAPPAQVGRRPHRFLPPSPDPIAAHSVRSTNARTKLSETSPAAAQHPAVQTPDRLTTSPGPGPAATPSGGSISPEDIALFRRVVESVTPHRQSDRLVLAPVPSAAPAQLKQRRQQAMGQPITPVLDVSDHYTSGHIEHDDTVFLQAGQGPHLVKGLKKGKWPVQASLDLHGSNLDDARERMDRFIQSCRDHDIRCVRIVHGKGYGSKDGSPVLKETVRRWLSQLAVVQAYIESDEANGGAGAVLVMLSKAKP